MTYILHDQQTEVFKSFLRKIWREHSVLCIKIFIIFHKDFLLGCASSATFVQLSTPGLTSQELSKFLVKDVG